MEDFNGILILFSHNFLEIARKKLDSTCVTPHVTRSVAKRGSTGNTKTGNLCSLLIIIFTVMQMKTFTLVVRSIVRNT